jgi:hypothetical protein
VDAVVAPVVDPEASSFPFFFFFFESGGKLAGDDFAAAWAAAVAGGKQAMRSKSWLYSSRAYTFSTLTFSACLRV